MKSKVIWTAVDLLLVALSVRGVVANHSIGWQAVNAAAAVFWLVIAVRHWTRHG